MSSFHNIQKKVTRLERLTIEEGLHLFELPDFEPARALAEQVAFRRHSDKVSYVINQHINYSNICLLRNVCLFCSFARLKKEEGAYEQSIADMVLKAKHGVGEGVSEIHIVGGLHPDLPFSYYEDLLSSLREACPSVHLKCFTAVEIHHLARISKKSIEDVLKILKKAGLNCLTGGGIEIMSERVRNLLCKAKLGANEWLSIVKKAHHLGIPSNATLLFGHFETKREILEHLCFLRELQDETKGFLSFIPLRFHPEGNKLSHLPGPTEDETLRLVAIARLMLDNFDHIKSYWVSMGLDLVCESFRYGADDIDGTVMDEKIYHRAGAQTPVKMTVMEMQTLISKANRTPVERDALYRPR